MAAWRSVRGHIERLDPDLTSNEDVERFFADEHILGRGRQDESGTGYEFELAVVGRRRRVATLDEEGLVIRGLSISELVVLLQERLEKIAVELGGKVAYGPIDLGVVDVDVDEYDLDPQLLKDLAAEREQTGENLEAEGRLEDTRADDDIVGDDVPDLKDGPMMVVANISMSEIPAIVNTDNTAVAVSKLGVARVLVAEESLTAYDTIFPRPSYVMALSTDRAKEANPTLIVRRDNVRICWEWEGELPPFGWIASNATAEQFVIDELGAGAVARLAVADVIEARFADVRQALLRDARDGTDALIRALGLPAEIGDVLEGRAPLAAIPASQIVQPQSFPQAFHDTLAWEIAGEGVVEPQVMNAVRKVYVDRPWLVSVASAAQAAASGAALAIAYSRAKRGVGSKMLTIIGIWSLLSAFTRIGTTTYLQEVMNRNAEEITTWQNVRNWHEATSQ
ncbi:MAG: hypothetical protein GX483_01505 [Actinomycetaceae bacterium]|nr:hypothetical protein [Actinomycetaceae bacterium]